MFQGSILARNGIDSTFGGIDSIKVIPKITADSKQSLPRPFEITVFHVRLQPPMEHHQGDPVIPTHFFQETPRRQTIIRSQWLVVGLFITCLALFIPRFVHAQASAGITGTVSDPSGAP